MQNKSKSKQAIQSQHILCGDTNTFINGIIFVENQKFGEIIEISATNRSFIDQKVQEGNYQLIDFGEDYILPGIIDTNCQIIFSDDNYNNSDSIISQTHSAILGGVTTIINSPINQDYHNFLMIVDLLKRYSECDFSLLGEINTNNFKEVLDIKEFIVGTKIYFSNIGTRTVTQSLSQLEAIMEFMNINFIDFPILFQTSKQLEKDVQCTSPFNKMKNKHRFKQEFINTNIDIADGFKGEKAKKFLLNQTSEKQMPIKEQQFRKQFFELSQMSLCQHLKWLSLVENLSYVKSDKIESVEFESLLNGSNQSLDGQQNKFDPVTFDDELEDKIKNSDNFDLIMMPQKQQNLSNFHKFQFPAIIGEIEMENSSAGSKKMIEFLEESAKKLKKNEIQIMDQVNSGTEDNGDIEDSQLDEQITILNSPTKLSPTKLITKTALMQIQVVNNLEGLQKKKVQDSGQVYVVDQEDYIPECELEKSESDTSNSKKVQSNEFDITQYQKPRTSSFASRQRLSSFKLKIDVTKTKSSSSISPKKSPKISKNQTEDQVISHKNQDPYFTISDERQKFLKKQIYAQYIAFRPPQWQHHAIQIVQELFSKSMKDSKSKIDSRYYIFHNAVHAFSLSKIMNMKEQFSNMKIIAEYSAPYIYFTHEQNFLEANPYFKNDPPLQSKNNKMIALNALYQSENIIDIIGSFNEYIPKKFKKTIKQKKFHCMQIALNGFLSIGSNLLGPWTGIYDFHMYENSYKNRNEVKRTIQVQLIKLSNSLSKKPAQIFQINKQKGSIQKGLDADFIVFDPESRGFFNSLLKQKDANLQSKMHVFQKAEIQGKVKKTYIRGKLVFDEKQDVKALQNTLKQFKSRLITKDL